MRAGLGVENSIGWLLKPLQLQIGDIQNSLKLKSFRIISIKNKNGEVKKINSYRFSRIFQFVNRRDSDDDILYNSHF
jgi:hypothetical protein